MNEGKSRRIMGFPDEFWIGFVIMIGIFLKLVYDVAAGYSVSTHNLGEWVAIINDIPNKGHLGVIQYYFTYHRMPNFDPSLISGYSNPPLFYVLSAIVLEIFYKNMSWSLGTVLHCIQCLNAVFVMVGSFAGIGILSKFGVRGRKQVASLLFMMFFPGFYNLGAAMDNTPLCFMFMMLALNTGLSWYRIRARRSLITSAVFLALGMMTKLTAFVVIVPMAVLFLSAHFYDRRSSYEDLYKALGLYAAIAFIPGLFYPLRNLIRFGTPFFYMDKEPEAFQQVGMYSVFQRIGFPSWASLTHLHLSDQTYYEYNIWGQTFKTSVVDESALNLTLKVTNGLAVILLVAVMLFTLAALVMMAYALVDDRLALEHKGFIAAGFLGILAAYMVRCFVNPTVSAMNFRQIPAMMIFLLAGYGMCGSETDRDNAFERMMSRVADCLILVISLLSAFLFGFYAL